MPVPSVPPDGLPLPVAALLRRSRNAKSPRDRHDTAYFAWEVAVRLGVAARPPADLAKFTRPSAGHWVAALVASDGAVADEPLLALFGHLTETGTGRREEPRSVAPRALLDALVAYRNKVIGHGASTRPPAFYDAGAALLAAGLPRLWGEGVFLPPGARLLHVETVEEDGERRRTARLLDLRASGAEILDPDGTRDVPDSVVKGRVVLRDGDRWTSLHPWVLFVEATESTVLFNSCERRAEYLDFASGETLRGAALDEAAPGAATEVARLLAERKPAAAAVPQPAEPPSPVSGGADPLVGRVVHGQYRIVRDPEPHPRPESSAFTGPVYEAVDVHLDRRVAIKVLPASRARDDEFVALFLREARALSRCDHPNVVTILAAGTEDGRAYYVMEYVEGRTLWDLTQERGPLPWEQACGLIVQACRGLQAVHERGIIHRDVKPGNLTLTPGGVLKITDFSLAHDTAGQRTTTIRATPYFAPPEQFQGREVDGRTDIYALGVTLYYVLTLQRAHDGAGWRDILQSILTKDPRSIREHRPELPERLWTIVRRMIQRDPAERHATCNDVIADLERLVATSAPAADGSAPGDPHRFGDYHLLGKLGEGGMGVVYLARQESLGRLVALKMLPQAANSDAVALARFRREVRALSRCDHPNVVKILAAGTERGQAYYAMEFVEGADLSQVFDVLSSSDDLDSAVSTANGAQRAPRAEMFADLPPVPPSPRPAAGGDKTRALAVAMRDAARGLQHLHERGIVHRDVKPANLMLTAYDHRVVVMDLGLALLADASSSLTQERTKVLGTLRYMAPEQLQRNLLQVDARSDVYGLGATFYELFTERRFLDGDSEERLIKQVLLEAPMPPRQANPRLPRDLATIVDKCTAKVAEARYPSMERVADDLSAYVEGRPISVRPPSFGYYLRLAVRRNRPLAAAVVGIAVVLVAAVVLSLHLLDESSESLRRARALGLANAAASSLESQPVRSLLLARVAVGLDPSPSATNAWRRAISESHERALLRGHEGAVNTAAFSRDGTRVVTASNDKTARIWDASGKQLAVLRGHEGGVLGAVFSPDGSRIVTASDDSTARIWDSSGKELAVLRGHESRVESAAFSPDGSRIVTTAGGHSAARIWDASGRELAVLRGHESYVTSAAFAPDGLRVVTASFDATARVWDVSGKELAILRGHELDVRSAAFSPDGSRIVTTSLDQTARIWDTAGTQLAVLRGEYELTSAAFSPDGSRVFTVSGQRFGASAAKTAQLWDASGGELAILRGHESAIECAAFSPDGSVVVTASSDKTARIWDSTGRQLAVLRGHEGWVSSVAFSPDGSRVVTASDDKTARIWDASGKEPAVLRGHEDRVVSAAFSSDGVRIVTASDDSTARIWDSSGKELTILRGHEHEVLSAAFSPDGSRVVTGSQDGTARTWDVSGKELAVLEGQNHVSSAAFSSDGSRVVAVSSYAHTQIWDVAGTTVAVHGGRYGRAPSAAFSPDGSRVITVPGPQFDFGDGIDKTVRLWDVSGKELAVLRGHESAVEGAAFSPDGSLVVTASTDKTARIWDAAGKELAVLRGHTDRALNAAFSPDGSRTVTASADKTARIWDIAGKELAVLRGHEDWVRTAVFSPDGSKIVTASPDKTARVWDLAGHEVAVLRGHEGGVNSAVFSPDGSQILTASDDGTARLWLVSTEDLLKLADERITRDFTDEERRTYADLLGDESPAKPR